MTSPYQAIRTLRQLADDEAASHSTASQVLRHDFYVNEVMTGRDSADALVELQQELISLLNRGGLSPRKWASNCSSVLQGVPAEHCVMRLPLQDHLEMDIKLLGVSYNATKDTFSIQTDATKAAQQLTKRQLLGEVARIYDPCG